MEKVKEKTPRIVFFILLFTIPPLALFLILSYDLNFSEKLNGFCSWLAGFLTILFLAAFLNHDFNIGKVFAAEKNNNLQARNEEPIMYIFEGEVPDNVKDIATIVPLSN